MEQFNLLDQREKEYVVLTGLAALHLAKQMFSIQPSATNTLSLSQDKIRYEQPFVNPPKEIGNAELMLERVSARFVDCEHKVSKLYDHLTGYKKGKQTELYVVDQLADLMPDARVTYVGGFDHQGDVMVDLQGTRILIECKNYSAAVPKSEIDKFISDVKGFSENSSPVKYGLFIAIGARIQGKRQVELARIDETNQQVAFLSDFDVFNMQALALVIRVIAASEASQCNKEAYANALQVKLKAQAIKNQALEVSKNLLLYSQYISKHAVKVKAAIDTLDKLAAMDMQ